VDYAKRENGDINNLHAKAIGISWLTKELLNAKEFSRARFGWLWSPRSRLLDSAGKRVLVRKNNFGEQRGLPRNFGRTERERRLQTREQLAFAR
jgi:hypothetical protein